MPPSDATAVTTFNPVPPGFSSDAFVHNCLLINELVAIARTAGAEQLPFIALKGAAMIIAGYDGTPVRPMTDIDLLVREADYRQWQHLFCKRGYTPLPFSKSSYVKDSRTPAIFDLHTSLRFISPRLLSSAWENCSSATYAGVGFKLLPPEIDLLYRSLHMTVTHGYGGKKWLDDLDAIIRTPSAPVDWEKLSGFARECRAAAPLSATVRLLRERCGTPIPGEAIISLEKHCFRPVAVLFACALRSRNGIPFFDYIAPLLLESSIPSMFVAAWSKMFPPIAVMRQRYGTRSNAKAAALYPLRVLHLAGKGLFAVCNALGTVTRSLLSHRPRHRSAPHDSG